MSPFSRTRKISSGDDASCRPREQGLVRMTCTKRDAHQTAVRLHQEFLRGRDASCVEAFFQTDKIVGNARSNVCIDDRRGEPRILTDNGQHFARERNAAVWQLLGYDLGGTLLVLRVDEREQKANSYRFDAFPGKILR